MRANNDEAVIEFLIRQGYICVRKLQGKWCAVMPLLLGQGKICYDMDDYGMRKFWMYETLEEAQDALEKWDGNDAPPGMWMKDDKGHRGPGSKQRKNHETDVH